MVTAGIPVGGRTSLHQVHRRHHPIDGRHQPGLLQPKLQLPHSDLCLLHLILGQLDVQAGILRLQVGEVRPSLRQGSLGRLPLLLRGSGLGLLILQAGDLLLEIRLAHPRLRQFQVHRGDAGRTGRFIPAELGLPEGVFGHLIVQPGDLHIPRIRPGLQGLQAGLGAGQGRLRRGEIRRARARRGLGLGEADPGDLQIDAGVLQLELQIPRVQLRQHLAGLHGIPHPHIDFAHDAGLGEGQVHQGVRLQAAGPADGDLQGAPAHPDHRVLALGGPGGGSPRASGDQREHQQDGNPPPSFSHHTLLIP